MNATAIKPQTDVFARVSTSVDHGGYNAQIWIFGVGIVWGDRYSTRERGRQAAIDWLDNSKYRELPRVISM
jgi:hypothetical protein